APPGALPSACPGTTPSGRLRAPEPRLRAMCPVPSASTPETNRSNALSESGDTLSRLARGCQGPLLASRWRTTKEHCVAAHEKVSESREARVALGQRLREARLAAG